VRDGAERHVSVKLEELSADKLARNGSGGNSDAEGSDDKAALGVAVEPLTPELASQLGIKNARGLVVDNVSPDSRAADAGIQQGDVIESVNRQPVNTINDLRAAIRKTADRPALLLINRKGSEVFVTVRPSNG
jgi:serine protease Do